MKSIDDKQLVELRKQVESLEQRQAEQSAVVAGLRRDLEQAKEDDLNREAVALQTWAAKPKPKAPEIECSLEAAEHDAEVLGRAWNMAQTDLGQYKAKHASRLARELQRAKAARARAVASCAKPLLEELRAFYAVDDDMKALQPYLPQERETGAPGSEAAQRYTLTVGGGMSTRNIYGYRVAGMERGNLEGVIRSLVQLSSAYPEVPDPGQEGQEAGGTDAA